MLQPVKLIAIKQVIIDNWCENYCLKVLTFGLRSCLWLWLSPCNFATFLP